MEETLPGDETFYKEVVGVKLCVPCSTWNDPDYCLKCFGENWQKESVNGEITKVKMPRGKLKLPQFTVVVPSKKYEKVYQGFGMDYIFWHSDELPPKYYAYKVQYIVRLASEAEKAGCNKGIATPP